MSPGVCSKFPPEREARELIPDAIDDKPEVLITTPDQPAGATSATATVAEAALPSRGLEPAGSDPASTREAISGTIAIAALDQPSVVAVNGTVVTEIGQIITTPLGQITITSIAPDAIGYSYTLTDNSTTPDATDVVTITVTDSDGDVATATLTLAIEDDAAIARADTDDVPAGSYLVQTGNVVSGVGTTSGAEGADTPGADGAIVTGIRAGDGTTFVAPGTSLNGQYGRLLINVDGSYVYVRNAGTPGGVSDVFTYRLTDGDGDTSTATLTIRIGDSSVSIVPPAAGEDGTRVHEAGLSERDDKAPGSRDGDGSNISFGVIEYKAADGPAVIRINGVEVVEEGQEIILPTGSFYIVAINPETIEYAFVLTDNIIGDPASQRIDVTITDRDGDTASSSFDIVIVDDAPTAVADVDRIAPGSFGAATGNVITDAEHDGGADIVGADGAKVTSVTGAGTAVAAGTPVAGLYGVLTLNADGSYSYIRNPGSPGGVNDVFTYSLTDVTATPRPRR
jgi:large repetitive protein